MAQFFFLLCLVFVKPEKMLPLHSGREILALNIIVTPIKSYSYPTNYPFFSTNLEANAPYYERK